MRAVSGSAPPPRPWLPGELSLLVAARRVLAVRFHSASLAGRSQNGVTLGASPLKHL